MFHRILPRGEQVYEPEMATSMDLFMNFLDWLQEEFRVMPLELIATRREGLNDRKRPSCALTFDDGWHDNFVYAFPLLRERKFPATIFLPVRFIGTSRRFWQERLWLCLQELKDVTVRLETLENCSRCFPWIPPDLSSLDSYGALKRFLMNCPSQDAEAFVECLEEKTKIQTSPRRSFLNWDEVRTMQRDGITYGSHTLHHTLLTRVAPRYSEEEIRASRAELSERLGVPVVGFSYPWGSSNPISHEQVVESGYSFAATATAGLMNSGTNPWLIPRIPVSSSILSAGSRGFDPEKACLSFAEGVFRSSIAPKKVKSSASRLERIRIVFVIDQIDGWKGGTESQLHALIRMLDRRYFDPQLICVVPFPEAPLDSFPCRVHFLRSEGHPLPSVPVRLKRLVRLLREIKPHVVQCYFPTGNTLGILAARLAKAPAIVGTTRNTTPAQDTLERSLLRLAGRLADYWQCNSRAVWATVREETGMPRKKLEIFPNVVDATRFSPLTPDERTQVRAKLGLTGRNPVIVSVANLRPIKDLTTLINAATSVRDELPDVCFLIVGEGPSYDELCRQVRQAGLTEVVRFVGGKPDVRPYLGCADIAVLTSRREGSSNSLLEYVAMELPTVVSDIPANRELVEGLFFRPGDPEDLADKLIKLWQDQSLTKCLPARNRKITSEFGTELFLCRAEGFYNRLIPRNSWA